jgi:hypothetical protein
MSNMISKLTRSETELLISCEDRIALGEKTFVDVGLALSEIREKRLYRETHNTFEDYCRQRWGWARQRANQLISAASVVENLTTVVVKPDSERQARPLAALPPEKQSAVWEKATAKAKEEGRQVVARDVQEAADEERPRVRTLDEEMAEPITRDYSKEYRAQQKAEIATNRELTDQIITLIRKIKFGSAGSSESFDRIMSAVRKQTDKPPTRI